MLNSHAPAGGIQPETIMAAARRFGRYTPENEIAVGKAKVSKKNEALELALCAWKRYELTLEDDFPYDAEWELYKKAISALEGAAFRPKEVEAFSIRLGALQGTAESEYFLNSEGVFLSALINTGNGKGFIVHTRHLGMPPDLLGYNNEKNIIVEGDCGACAGQYMEGGTMLVKGSVGRYAGANMRGGRLLIEGDAVDGLGSHFNEGGTIIVKGNAACDIFPGKGGGIFVEGRIGRIIPDIGTVGKVYHKGRLVFPSERY